jgi:predicted nucleic acid-binding protein
VIAVDTSVVLQWVLLDPTDDDYSELIGQPDLAAPDVILVEAANVLTKKVRLGEIGEEQARDGLRFLRSVIPTQVDLTSLIDRSFELSIALSHPVYDCVFLACAERLSCRLATRDKLFARRVRDRGMGDLLAEPVP